MKKRLAALILCLTMCLGTGAEAWAAAENISDSVVSQTTDTIDVEVPVEDVPTVVSEPAEELPVEILDEAVAPEEPVVDVPEMEEPTEETPADEVPSEDGIVEEPVVDESAQTGEEVILEEVAPEAGADLFTSGTTENDAFSAEEETMDPAGYELQEGEVFASQWEQDPANGKWKLKVPTVIIMSAGETEENEEAVPAAGESYDYVKNAFGEITTVDAEGNIIHKGVYYFDTEGYLVTGRSTIAEGTKCAEGTYGGPADAEYFFMDEARATILNDADSVATPANSNLGQMQKNYKWLWDDGAFHTYGSDGAAVKITANTIYKINGEYYYLLEGGVPAVGLKKATYGKNTGYYYFEKAASADEIPGKMARDKWVYVGKHATKGVRWWYFQKNGLYKNMGIVAVKLTSADRLYLVGADGYLIKGKMVKGANGYYYASNKSGHCYRKAIVKIGNYRYYFVNDGRRATWKNRWVQCTLSSGKRYYYFGSVAGRIAEKKGWQKITVSGKFVGWFYFTSNGNHYINKWSGDRYFLSDGRLASGVVKVDDKYYFFERSSSTAYRGKMYKRTWINYNNKWYYATANGPLLSKRWTKIGNDWYYFEESCEVRVSRRAILKGTYGWLDSRGRFTTGWVVINDSKNIVRYMDSKTGEIAKNTSKEIDGLTYYFDAKGNRINDLTKTSHFAQYERAGSYYVEVDRQNGVMTIYNSSRNVPLKTIRVSVGNPISLTRTGTFRIKRAGRWQALMGPSWGQYGSHVNGGIYVHSIACTYQNAYNLPAGEYLKLGSPASHGCIRCCVADAKWVWDNCNGSVIRIFDGVYTSQEAFKGPLGRNPLTPLRGAGNFDPTDPNV